MRLPPPIVLAAAVLAGCSGVQSALAPGGADAARLAEFTRLLAAAGGLILLLVIAVAAFALFATPRRRAWLGTPAAIVGNGLLFPSATLAALLVYVFAVVEAPVRSTGEAPLRIEVLGHQFWWRVIYLDAEGTPELASANEVRVPTGRTVALSLRSADVIHSFWVPSLGGKLDMIPGRTNTLLVKAERPGVYRGQCAEFCGAQHARMAFYVVAEPPEAFTAWLARERGPAAEPANALLERGRALFLQSGCGACHTVRGTAADGRVGPDLSRVGGRRSLAAGTLPNEPGTMAAWIAGSEHIKPGNGMPPFDIFDAPELHAIASYLESLR